MEASCKTVEAGERKEKQKHVLEARKLFLQQSFIMKSKLQTCVSSRSGTNNKNSLL